MSVIVPIYKLNYIGLYPENIHIDGIKLIHQHPKFQTRNEKNTQRDGPEIIGMLGKRFIRFVLVAHFPNLVVMLLTATLAL